jgi:hypothetical protein
VTALIHGAGVAGYSNTEDSMTTLTRFLTGAAVIVAALNACAPPAGAGVYQRGGVVYIRRAPPPPMARVVVASPGPGYAWFEGRWVWNARRADYEWEPGRYVLIPAGYRRYEPGRWVHRRQGYLWIEGRWR